VSFLACRLRGLEAFVESHATNPEELCRLVRRYSTILTNTVLDHGGIMDQMIAGGFSAFFDTPSEESHHAVVACACAIAMLAEADALHRSGTGEALGIAIGLSTGAVVLGDVGTEDHPHDAAMGRPVEMAATLERLCAVYGARILTSPTTWKAADRSFPFLHMDYLADGKDKALPIYVLLPPPLSRSHPKFLALKSFHAHIFEAFQTRNWDRARNLVAQCRALSEANSVLYDFYAERITHYEANPPRPDWTGALMPAQF
jgi:adenylate cyclase